MAEKFKLTGFRLSVVLTLTVALFFVFFSDGFALFEFIELKTLDIRFKLRGELQPSEDIVIAVIDDTSIEAIGRWPWSRAVFGALIDSLSMDGAKVIGFDVIYSEPEENRTRVALKRLKSIYDSKGVAALGRPGRDFEDLLNQAISQEPDSDQLLADAMKDYGRVISTIVFHTFSEEGTYSGTAPPSSGEDVPPPELLEDSGEGSGEEPPPGLLEQLEAVAPGDDTGWEEYAPDAFVPDKVKDEAYTHIIGGDKVPMFGVPKAEGILMPIDRLLDASHGFGFVNFSPDIDGGLRWENNIIEFFGKYYPSIGIRMLQEYFGFGSDDLEIIKGKGIRIGTTLIPVDKKGRLLINYYGPFGTMKYYSIVDIIEGNLPPGTFRDKIVIVGGAATGLGDVWLTPFDPSLPGVEKHATIISNVLQNDFLKQPSYARIIALALMIISGLALGYFIPRLSSVLHVFIFTTSVLIAIVGVAAVLFIYFDTWVNMVYPVINIFAISVGVVVYQYFTEEKEKRQIKKAFKMYLNDALVEQLAESHDALKLGGEEKELSVLFSDIRNFTSISEGMTPEQLVSLINTYLSLMTRIIMEENGTVDKYIGDAIMAIYGAPVFSPSHPDQACRTALRMMKELQSVRPEWKELGYPDMNIGIGINTGLMVVGNMGSEERFDYTVMGDSVNLASRLEGLTKTYGTGIIISEYTAEKIEGYILKDLDLVRVKGKDRPIKIFELIGEGVPSGDLSREMAAYSEAISFYRAMEWERAHEAFSELASEHDSTIYAMYRERCSRFLSSPPGDDWDGVYTFTTK